MFGRSRRCGRLDQDRDPNPRGKGRVKNGHPVYLANLEIKSQGNCIYGIWEIFPYAVYCSAEDLFASSHKNAFVKWLRDGILAVQSAKLKRIFHRPEQVIVVIV